MRSRQRIFFDVLKAMMTSASARGITFPRGVAHKEQNFATRPRVQPRAVSILIVAIAHVLWNNLAAMIRVVFYFLLLTAPAALYAEDASAVYEARYQTTGYLLRAANVCQADKAQIAATFALVSSDEMKAFSRAFPRLTEQWMTNGANLFNTSVLKAGLQPACDYALETLKKANSPR